MEPASRQARRQKFLENLTKLPRLRQTIACVACRTDKKACHGDPLKGCDRCLARSLDCVFSDEDLARVREMAGHILPPSVAPKSKRGKKGRATVSPSFVGVKRSPSAAEDDFGAEKKKVFAESDGDNFDSFSSSAAFSLVEPDTSVSGSGDLSLASADRHGYSNGTSPADLLSLSFGPPARMILSNGMWGAPPPSLAPTFHDLAFGSPRFSLPDTFNLPSALQPPLPSPFDSPSLISDPLHFLADHADFSSTLATLPLPIPYLPLLSASTETPSHSSA